MFPNSIVLGLMNNLYEDAAVLISAVIVTREHVDSPEVFYNGSFQAFKEPYFSE